MEEQRPLKIVPSGKVYRQKFDAEVNELFKRDYTSFPLGLNCKQSAAKH